MSFVEAVILMVLVAPLSVLLCAFVVAVTYLQVTEKSTPPKENKDLQFNTLSSREMKEATAHLLKQDKRRRAKYVSRQRAEELRASKKISYRG